MKTQPALIWNSSTRKYALVSYELGSAMLHVGNAEGFNRLSRTPGADFRVVIRQFPSTGCSVDIETETQTYSCTTAGRIEGKELAGRLHDAFGWPVFNVKRGGKLVAVTA